MGNIENAVNLTDYFVALPQTRYLLTAIVLLGMLTGIGINIDKYGGTELLVRGSIQGILVLTLPAIISACVIKVLIYRIPFKRIVATTLIGEIIYAITYAAGMVVATFNPTYAKFIVLIGAALVFIMWYTVARLVFVLKWRSLLFAVIQLMFHLIFFLSSSIVNFGSEPIGAITEFYIAALVFLAAMYLFFLIINAPMRRNFGFSSTDAISMFAAQWLYQDKELEEAFETVGEPAKVPLTLFCFRRNKKKDVFFIIPSIHFGPFGNLGGSEFTQLIAAETTKKYGANAFVFHGTATHDLNPIASEELSKVMNCMDACLQEIKYVSSKVALLQGKQEECFAETLLFNDSAFVSLSRAPNVTEDINFGLGSLIASEAEKYVKIAGIADQHNSETGEVTSFEPGSLVGYNYLEAVKASLESKAAKKELELGVSEREINSPFVGKAGLKVAIFTTDPMATIILLDANGITPEFREKLISEATEVGKKYGKKLHPMVFTTDTHQINSVQGVLNPLKEDETIVREVSSAVAEAIQDISESKLFVNKKWFEINVLGAKQSIEIVSTVNSIVAVAKIAAPLILIAGIAVVVAIVSII